MASYTTPRIFTYKSSAAIGKGRVVKMGADREHVAIASAATDAVVGLTQGEATAAEQMIEIALQGGGGKAVAGGTVTVGALLTSDANGAAIVATVAGSQIIGKAMEAAVSGDIFSVEVCYGTLATGA